MCCWGEGVILCQVDAADIDSMASSCSSWTLVRYPNEWLAWCWQMWQWSYRLVKHRWVRGALYTCTNILTKWSHAPLSLDICHVSTMKQLSVWLFQFGCHRHAAISKMNTWDLFIIIWFNSGLDVVVTVTVHTGYIQKVNLDHFS